MTISVTTEDVINQDIMWDWGVRFSNMSWRNLQKWIIIEGALTRALYTINLSSKTKISNLNFTIQGLIIQSFIQIQCIHLCTSINTIAYCAVTGCLSKHIAFSLTDDVEFEITTWNRLLSNLWHNEWKFCITASIMMKFSSETLIKCKSFLLTISCPPIL